MRDLPYLQRRRAEQAGPEPVRRDRAPIRPGRSDSLEPRTSHPQSITHSLPPTTLSLALSSATLASAPLTAPAFSVDLISATFIATTPITSAALTSSFTRLPPRLTAETRLAPNQEMVGREARPRPRTAHVGRLADSSPKRHLTAPAPAPKPPQVYAPSRCHRRGRWPVSSTPRRTRSRVRRRVRVRVRVGVRVRARAKANKASGAAPHLNPRPAATPFPRRGAGVMWVNQQTSPTDPDPSPNPDPGQVSCGRTSRCLTIWRTLRSTSKARTWCALDGTNHRPPPPDLFPIDAPTHAFGPGGVGGSTAFIPGTMLVYIKRREPGAPPPRPTHVWAPRMGERLGGGGRVGAGMGWLCGWGGGGVGGQRGTWSHIAYCRRSADG